MRTAVGRLILASAMAPADSVLRLNVGGTRFIFLKSCLRQYPDTLLGKLAQMPKSHMIRYSLWDGYFEDEDSLFFNRPAHLFAPVAEFYQTGKIHAGSGVCPLALKEELKFWGIYGRHHRTSCCNSCYRKRDSSATGLPCESTATSSTTRTNEVREGIEETEIGMVDPTAPLPNGPIFHMNIADDEAVYDTVNNDSQEAADVNALSLRERVWNLMEGITQNKWSLALNILSILFILLNISLIILDSMPHYHWSDYATSLIYRQNRHKDASELSSPPDQFGNEEPGHLTFNSSGPVFHVSGDGKKLNDKEILALYGLDWACTIAFTLEFAIKLWSAPNRCTFLRQVMTIIDILAILPAYIETILNLTRVVHKGGLSILHVIRIFRAFRVFRILKLARYESSFKVLGNCLRDCIPEFVLLGVYLFMATLLFGTMLYYADGHEIGTYYKTIPDAVWWAVVTYFSFSDAPPRTIFGKIVAATGSIAGVVLMALPVSVIVDKFSRFLNEFRAQRRKESAMLPQVPKTSFVRVGRRF